jgi:hypothetical protein
MCPLPDDCKIVPGTLGYSDTDTGDFYLSFRALPEHIPVATAGVITGWVVPKAVERPTRQFIGELRDHNIHIVVTPRRDRDSERPLDRAALTKVNEGAVSVFQGSKMAENDEAEQHRRVAREIRELARQMHRNELKERTFALALECERWADLIEADVRSNLEGRA